MNRPNHGGGNPGAAGEGGGAGEFVWFVESATMYLVKFELFATGPASLTRLWFAYGFCRGVSTRMFKQLNVSN